MQITNDQGNGVTVSLIHDESYTGGVVLKQFNTVSRDDVIELETSFDVIEKAMYDAQGWYSKVKFGSTEFDFIAMMKLMSKILQLRIMGKLQKLEYRELMSIESDIDCLSKNSTAVILEEMIRESNGQVSTKLLDKYSLRLKEIKT